MIYFWLIYVPTMCLLAEAYDDVYSSFKLQETIKEALNSIKDNTEMFQLNENCEEWVQNMIHYGKSRLFLKFIVSLINSHDFTPPNNNETWLVSFKKIAAKSQLKLNSNGFDELMQICHITPAIDLKSAEALYWLECAKEHVKDEHPTMYIENALTKCIEYNDDCRKKKKFISSDFVTIFLDFYRYYLDNKKEIDEKLKGKIDKDKINEFYDDIFKRIVGEKWIARKREIVEKFLDCQTKLLGNINNNEKSDEKSIESILGYHIEFIKIILNPDRARKLLKKFPDCEKEKLIKRFRSEWGKEIIDNPGKYQKIRKNYKEIDDVIGHDSHYKVPNSYEEVITFIEGRINCDYYTKKLKFNTEEFNDHLIYESSKPTLRDCYGLTILRRWQSFTPALSMGSEVGHKGGGYFVYKTNGKGEIEEGLVVDPGFDFLENFFDEGFSIRDIHAVLITHSHRDHSCDLMSIVTLVHEMNMRGKRVFPKWKERKLLLFITEGCHQNFSAEIYRSKDEFRDIIRVMQGEKYDVPCLENFLVTVTKANHHDLTDHDSVGYIIRSKDGNSKPLIGFTGDTQWYHEIEHTYKDCPVLCVNLGGVVDMFKDEKVMLSDFCIGNSGNPAKCTSKIKKVLLRENHLYLPGFCLMAKGFNKKNQKLLILSELCEEMKGGLRTDLSTNLSDNLEIPVLPEDIGLTVILRRDGKKQNGYVFCKVCNFPKAPKDIVPIETDQDNAIVYLCKEHYKQLKEGYVLPKINELELEANELRKPIITKSSSFVNSFFRKRFQ